MKQNAIAAGIISIVQSALPFLVLVGVINWTSDTIAAAVLVTTNIVTTAGYLFAQSQKPVLAPLPGTQPGGTPQGTP